MVNTQQYDNVIENARLIGVGRAKFENVYTVGPFGRSVGFAFQQIRAINLITSLHERGKIDSINSIAIIGGGIAGVTAALVLQELEYEHVTIYEEKDTVLLTQKHAFDRLVHPSYNYWPLDAYECDEDKCLKIRFSSTTKLPCLNWEAGSASEVVEEIRKAWVKEYAKSDNISSKHKLIDLDKTADGKVKLIFESKDPHNVDVVILCTGFGVERDLEYSDFKSYWDDSLDDKDRESSSFVISGLGDGALHDILRLVIKRDKLNSVLTGVIAKLRHVKYQSFYSRQSDININGESLGEMSAIEKEIYNAENSSEPNAADNLKDCYERIVKTKKTLLRDVIESEIDDSFLRGQQNKITLLGRLKHPYGTNAAPIHKLILAYLLEYHKPKIVYKENVEFQKEEGGNSCTVISTNNRTVISDLTALANDNSLCLRHGSESFVEKKWFSGEGARQFTDFVSGLSQNNQRDVLGSAGFEESELKDKIYAFVINNYGSSFGVEIEQSNEFKICKIYNETRKSGANDTQAIRKLEESISLTGGLDEYIYGARVEHIELPSVVNKK